MTMRVAVLGAGILGACLSLMLARRGHEVTLFDQRSEPVAAASRWNEGKIHLGYLYGADPGLGTARHLLPGSLQFAPLISQLLETDLLAHTTSTDDLYLVHRNSVAGPDALAATFAFQSTLPCSNSSSFTPFNQCSTCAPRATMRVWFHCPTGFRWPGGEG